MLKRPRDQFDTPVSSSPPYAKRVQLTSSSAASSSVFSSPLKSYNVSIPADSPSNPFSLKLKNVVTLPRAVSFTKYYALRFQLVTEPKPSTSRRVKASTSYRQLATESYRIVHVPPNYSFKLLYKLIRFLFDLEPGPDHVFEVQEGVEMYAVSANKVGKVKKGKTYVKLSRNFDDQLKMTAGKGKGRQKKSDSEEDVIWEGEDDFAVARAWPEGLVQDRAILYRHDSERAVHITMNLLKFPPRKGSSSRPFVFLAGEEEEQYDYWNGKKSFQKYLQTSIEDVMAEDTDDDDDLPQSVPSSDPMDPITPAPSEPLLIKRLDSAHRRMSRQLPKSKHDVEEDESTESEEEQEESPQNGQEEETEEVHGDDWDPFGDEAEL